MFLVCMERDSRYFHQWSNQHSRPWLPRPKRQGFGRVAGFPSLGRNYWLEKTGNCLKLLERLEVRKSQMNSSFEMQCVLAKNMSKDYSSSILFIQYRTWRSHNVTSLSLTRYALGKKNCEWHKWRQANFSVRIVWAPAKVSMFEKCSNMWCFYWDMSVYWSHGDMYTLLCRTGNAFPHCSLGSFLPRCTICAEMHSWIQIAVSYLTKEYQSFSDPWSSTFYFAAKELWLRATRESNLARQIYSFQRCPMCNPSGRVQACSSYTVMFISRALTLFAIIWHCLPCSLVMHRHARWPLLGLDTIVLTHLFLRLEKHNSEEIEGPCASLVHVCIFLGTCDTDSSWTLWYNIPYTSAFYAPLRLRKVLSYHVHVFVCVLFVFCFFYPTKFI